ncbi:hypothetical protein V8F20_012001 [Naviculisporaceae sp. PSN 640]
MTRLTLPVVSRPGEPANAESTSSTSMIQQTQPVKIYSEAEWAAHHAEIERLYIGERRKLRSQMYKKRFAKWGFQKYKKRWATAHPTLSALNMACPESDVKLMFLASVRTWSSSFFEQPSESPDYLSRYVEVFEITTAFKLVIDLLRRGYGELAGRVARKAFLLVEQLLVLDGPVLVWNLLDLMHHMALSHACPGGDSAHDATSRQLFQMLVGHVEGLVLARTHSDAPETHPLPTMLRLLRRLVTTTTVTTSNQNSTSAPSPATITTIASLLEQAWNLNVKMLFDHFSPDMLHLYWHISWDSCSIGLAPHVLTTVMKRLCQLEKESKVYVQIVPDTEPDQISSPDPNSTTSSAAGPPKSPTDDTNSTSSPPPDQEQLDMLYADGMEALRERGSRITDSSAAAAADQEYSTKSFRQIYPVNKQHILESIPETSVPPPRKVLRILKSKLPQIQAMTAAWAIKSSILVSDRIDKEKASSTALLDQLRTVVSLNEFTYGRTAPQVVREMWALEDALLVQASTANCQEQPRRHAEKEARTVNREWRRRLARYVDDIPVYSV